MLLLNLGTAAATAMLRRLFDRYIFAPSTSQYYSVAASHLPVVILKTTGVLFLSGAVHYIVKFIKRRQLRWLCTRNSPGRQSFIVRPGRIFKRTIRRMNYSDSSWKSAEDKNILVTLPPPLNRTDAPPEGPPTTIPEIATNNNININNDSNTSLTTHTMITATNILPSSSTSQPALIKINHNPRRPYHRKTKHDCRSSKFDGCGDCSRNNSSDLYEPLTRMSLNKKKKRGYRKTRSGRVYACYV